MLPEWIKSFIYAIHQGAVMNPALLGPFSDTFRFAIYRESVIGAFVSRLLNRGLPPHIHRKAALRTVRTQPARIMAVIIDPANGAGRERFLANYSQ